MKRGIEGKVNRFSVSEIRRILVSGHVVHVVERDSPQQPTSDAPPLHDRLRETIVERIDEAVRRMVAHASDDIVYGCLRESTDIGSMIRLLSDVGVADIAEINPLAAAYLRGVETKQRLLEEAGGVFSTGEVAKLLGMSEQGVHARLARKKLLAVSIGGTRNRFPACQFTSDGVVPGIDSFLAACNVDDPWTQLALLLDPQPALDGKSILEALRTNQREAAVRVASTFAA